MILQDANYISSHFCDERPAETVIDLLVIHNISLPPGQFGTREVHNLFTGQLNPEKHEFFKSIHGLKVSAHFLIERNGVLTQFVPCDKRAWHAGVSEFRGRQACNDFSIGIELEGTDELPFENQQYEQLIKLTKYLMECYPHITTERIVGHCHIAPQRKTDPGPNFDWQRYKAALSHLSL
ncbi:MAG: 1,6-anhydro-N-acetylmuramyl-L-alanine amidase AmpD [Pseudomonadota bacterium]